MLPLRNLCRVNGIDSKIYSAQTLTLFYISSSKKAENDHNTDQNTDQKENKKISGKYYKQEEQRE